jgi:hypothetical protein
MLRYPEKSLFWFALTTALLVGWGLERVLTEELPRHTLLACALGLCLLGALAAVVKPTLVAQAASASGQAAQAMGVQARGWMLALLIGGVLLLLCWLAARAKSAAGLLLLQLIGLLQLAPLLPTDEVERYRTPPWRGLLAPQAAVFNTALADPRWHPGPRYDIPDGPDALVLRAQALDLAPAPGVLSGLTYPLAPDLEGMGSPLQAFVLSSLPVLSDTSRLRWLRAVGVEALVAPDEGDGLGLPEIARAQRYGVVSRLLKVNGPAPLAWWPAKIVIAADPLKALLLLSSEEEPVASVVLSRAAHHVPGGEVQVLRAEPDLVELAVRSEGGVAVVRRAFHPLWRARTAQGELRTLAANLNLLAVDVPPGEVRVELYVSSRPEQVALALALLAFAAALVGMRR